MTKRSITPIAIFLFCLTLAACHSITPERRFAMSTCAPDAWQKYPAVVQQQSFTNSRTLTVPTGDYSCSVKGTGDGQKTHCDAEKKTVTEYYPDVRTVDINSNGRNAYQNACADTLCMKQFSNLECKPPK